MSIRLQSPSSYLQILAPDMYRNWPANSLLPSNRRKYNSNELLLLGYRASKLISGRPDFHNPISTA